ncbi:cupin domain-containing protein [Agrobacterium fabrum]|uniref:cupin domain-containing protein n=1 Tax=Agrobacterium fabrum TaxID=1176649 RepID=UPI000EF5D1A2|nr:cupin domain-containing protein [Agrobacterium fabrum]AYM66194.1 hypothetical protein At12D13_50420 [Agrobacterium fabrum]NTE63941.1 cupin domain-containing protein [Agrobacterium fabrum]
MPHPIVNIDSVAPQELPEPYAPTGPAAALYAPRVARIGLLIGANALGCNLIVLAPGKRAFPFHNHRNNEEMFIILEGCGEVRIGDETFPIKAHDMISCPAGDPKTAHQICNTSGEILRYVAISTMHATDIVEYPDSGRFRIVHGPTSNGSADESLDIWATPDEDASYWGTR